MFDDNRERLVDSHEAADKEFEAARRQLPRQLRKDSFADARSWLAANALRPVVDASARVGDVAAYHGYRYWRRSSSRTLGLLLNGFAQLRELLPGRPSMA